LAGLGSTAKKLLDTMNRPKLDLEKLEKLLEEAKEATEFENLGHLFKDRQTEILEQYLNRHSYLRKFFNNVTLAIGEEACLDQEVEWAITLENDETVSYTGLRQVYPREIYVQEPCKLGFKDLARNAETAYNEAFTSTILKLLIQENDLVVKLLNALPKSDVELAFNFAMDQLIPYDLLDTAAIYPTKNCGKLYIPEGLWSQFVAWCEEHPWAVKESRKPSDLENGELAEILTTEGVVQVVSDMFLPLAAKKLDQNRLIYMKPECGFNLIRRPFIADAINWAIVGQPYAGWVFVEIIAPVLIANRINMAQVAC
jgi:hypothetical protein